MKYLMTAILLCLAGAALGADFVKTDVATAATINKIYFADNNQGWAVSSDGELLSTYNGGQSWKIRKIAKRNITDFAIRGRQAYVVGEKGLIMKSEDAGASWKDISLNIMYNFSGIAIINDTCAVVCGTNQNSISKSAGILFQTWDRGRQWKKQRHLGNGYTDIQNYSKKKVYILAAKKFFHSVSAGFHYWEGEYSDSRMGFAFECIDDWGYIVGLKGLFVKTSDHGRNWEAVNLEATKNLYGISLYDKSSGVAVGEDGIVINFFKDASRIVTESCGFDVDLRCVEITETHIFCGGDDGTILRKDRFPRAEP